jgi:hypothetical protein
MAPMDKKQQFSVWYFLRARRCSQKLLRERQEFPSSSVRFRGARGARDQLPELVGVDHKFAQILQEFALLNHSLHLLLL